MRTPAARLRLVGEGDDLPSIERQVRALGLTARVELAGFRPDPAPDLRAADVVMIPSRYDGMALVLLEAMACGAAIVATDVAGASALDGAGILVPPADPEALAAAADELLADANRRQSLGRAARTRVVQHYCLRRSIDDTFRLWRELGALPPSMTPTGEIPHKATLYGRTQG